MNGIQTNLTVENQSQKTLYWFLSIFSLWVIALIIYSFHLSRWGHDGIHHLAGLAELYGPFSRGQFDTVLSPELHYGQGLPTFVFYSQMLYLPPFIFTLFGFGLTPSFSLTFISLIGVAWFGFFKLARLHAPANIAILGATMFVGCNYFLGDIYTRFAYGEFFIYALLPFTLYSLNKAMLSANHFAMLFAILMLTTSILVHPISFMNLIPLLGVYCFLVLPDKAYFWNFLIKGLIITFSTILLTSYFWLPGIIERPYVIGESVGDINYSNSFWNFDRALLNTQHWLSLGPFLNCILLLTICAQIFFIRSHFKTYSLLGCIFFYVFMCTPLSAFIWDSISILQANQFVTRMLMPLSIAVSLYFVYVANAWFKKPISATITLALCLIILLQASLFIYRHTKEIPSSATFAQTFPKDINTQLQYRLENYVTRTSGIGISEFKPNIELSEYLVSPTNDCGIKPPLPPYVKDIQRDNIVIAYNVNKKDCFLRLPIIWNIRFKAIDHNGENLSTGFNENGTLMIETVSTNGTIGLRFTEPSYVKWATRISQLTLLTIVLVILFLQIRVRKKRISNSSRLSST